MYAVCVIAHTRNCASIVNLRSLRSLSVLLFHTYVETHCKSDCTDSHDYEVDNSAEHCYWYSMLMECR